MPLCPPLPRTFAHSAAVWRVFVDDDLLHQLVVAQFPHRRRRLWTLERTAPRLFTFQCLTMVLDHLTLLRCVS